MTIDRYTKVVLTVIALALVALAGRPWTERLLAALAPDPVQAQTIAKYEVPVPKAWGKLVGFSNGNLLLESAEGLRIVDVEGKPPEYPKVKALVKFQ
ncbi:MAG TPA: hypothetical protein VNN07_19035 [Candidatus Tectomicrobia bacterium]|nr:hypothetical protein [Candidatus Tectomicrobia bacterium]